MEKPQNDNTEETDSEKERSHREHKDGTEQNMAFGIDKSKKHDVLSPEVIALIEKLRKHNLDDNVWVPIFLDRKIQGDKLEKIDDEIADDILKIAAERSSYDIAGLQNLLYSSLILELDKVGLGCSYWVGKFKAKGITDKIKLENIDENTFKYLNQNIRHGWEANSLKKLYKTADIEEKLKELEARNKDITGLMGSMGTRFGDYSDRRQALKDDTLDYKLKHDEVMRRMQKEPSGSVLVPREGINDRQLIESISAGQILRGLFFHKGFETSTIYRRRLIKIPKSEAIQLAACDLPETTEIFEINEEDKCSEFENTLKKFGITAAVAFKASNVPWSVKLAGGYETRSEKSHAKRKESVFAKVYQLLNVPLASFALYNFEVQLSDGAYNALKKLERSKQFSDDCIEFFNIFGSHYFDGEQHFGGRYEWVVTSKSDSSGDETRNVEMAKMALAGSISGVKGWFSGEFSFEGEKSTDSMTNRKQSSEKYQVSKRLTKTGGPQEADDIPLWKQGLASYRNTWHIIDRDTSVKSYVGVWELIKSPPFDEHLKNKVYSTWKDIYEKDSGNSMDWSKIQLGLEYPSSKHKTSKPEQYEEMTGRFEKNLLYKREF